MENEDKSKRERENAIKVTALRQENVHHILDGNCSLGRQ